MKEFARSAVFNICATVILFIIMLLINFIIAFAIGLIPGIGYAISAVPKDPDYVITFMDRVMIVVIVAGAGGGIISIVMTILESLYGYIKFVREEGTFSFYKAVQRGLKDEKQQKNLNLNVRSNYMDTSKPLPPKPPVQVLDESKKTRRK